MNSWDDEEEDEQAVERHQSILETNLRKVFISEEKGKIFFVWNGFCKRTIKSSMHFMPCMWSCSATTQLRDKVNVHWISFCINLFVHKYQSFLIRGASKNACHTCCSLFLVTAMVTIGCWPIPLLWGSIWPLILFLFAALMLEEMVKICESQLTQTPTPMPTRCFNVWINSQHLSVTANTKQKGQILAQKFGAGAWGALWWGGGPRDRCFRGTGIGAETWIGVGVGLGRGLWQTASDWSL